MDDHFIQLRVVYEDLPDMIELGLSLRYRGWSGRSKAYTSPDLFHDQANALLDWARIPNGRARIEAGADTGIGWMVLEFYTIDRAGHARCSVILATGQQGRDSRPEETWRLMIELETELGLIERFARECISLSKNFSGDARLIAIVD